MGLAYTTPIWAPMTTMVMAEHTKSFVVAPAYEGRNASLRRSASISPVAAAGDESKAQFSNLEFVDRRRLLYLVSGRVWQQISTDLELVPLFASSLEEEMMLADLAIDLLFVATLPDLVVDSLPEIVAAPCSPLPSLAIDLRSSLEPLHIRPPTPPSSPLQRHISRTLRAPLGLVGLFVDKDDVSRTNFRCE
ncbi:uncharacterized protein A4U43_C03F7560 [Asparagus officinalis]|uniref:Uncharacterized protein n=1 Tax=Asparagus officinalis TaxID=4686 RepID=A0A5P1FDD6_ASPOF|nr:uncharacterized protein A4U43_C03F7560 [Asparagus officinalis]